MTASGATKPLNQKVSISHTRQMFIECRGSGGPTVVLISRLQIAGDLWAMWKVANSSASAPNPDHPALERLNIDATLQQVADARSIRQMPLVVLTGDKPVDPAGFPPGIPASFARVIDQTQHVSQSQLARLVNASTATS